MRGDTLFISLSRHILSHVNREGFKNDKRKTMQLLKCNSKCFADFLRKFVFVLERSCFAYTSMCMAYTHKQRSQKQQTRYNNKVATS